MKILFLLFVFSAFLFSQTTKITQLKTNIQKAQTSLEKAKLTYKLGGSFARINVDSAKYYFQENFDIYRYSDDDKLRFLAYKSNAVSFQTTKQYHKSVISHKNLLSEFENLSNKDLKGIYNNLALAFDGIGSFNLAVKNYKKSIDIAILSKDSTSFLRYKYNLGRTLIRSGNYEDANKVLHNALIISEKLEKNRRSVKILNMIGVLHKKLEDYTSALKFYNRALLLSKKYNFTAQIGDVLGNIGTLYGHQKKYKKALFYHNQSLQIANNRKDKQAQASILNNIGWAYEHENKLDSALFLYQSSLQIKEEIRDSLGIARTLNNIGFVNFSVGKINKSIKIILKSQQIAKSIHAEDIIYSNYSALVDLYEAQKDFKNSLKYMRLYHKLEKKVQGNMRLKTIKKLETEYDVKLKDKQIKIQTLELQKEKSQRLIYASGLGGALFLLLLLSFYFRQRTNLHRKNTVLKKKEHLLEIEKTTRESKQYERKRMAEILHDDIGNRLGAVDQFVDIFNADTEENEIMSKVSDQLKYLTKATKMLSYEMDADSDYTEPFDKKLKNYIDFFNGKGLAKIHLDIQDDRPLSENIKISLFRGIQEALSNAIKHSGATNIWLKISRNQDHLDVSVKDDGTGFSKDSAKVGKGLSNMNAVAEYLGGTFDINTSDTEGTTCQFNIPLAV